ncbi:MAG: M18 family aminopeptidase [Erysipelotrichaceae bacterium]|nr:M18 family aminopeptidase [Erysipelotrichaceae bacterium]
MKDLIKFLNNSPTAFEAVENISEILKENGYEELKEEETFKIRKGGKYYVSRNGSSLIAFNVGRKLNDPSLQITASHGDCPTFKIKPESAIFEDGYLKLDTEVYGGALYYPWFDRPLSIAGRLVVKDRKGTIKVRSYVHGKPFCLIPSQAIHFNRKANEELKFNAQVDLLPICALKKKDLKEYLKEETKEEVLSYDLYLYPLQSAYVWGMDDEFISSFHLDDLECAYTCLKGFVDTFNDDNVNVYCCFDNEEVGSLTRQGAASDFLENTLKRVCEALKLDYYVLLAKGMLLSCDNAQGLHPNHPEKYDILNRPLLNKGIVIKSNANQSYTSDALSSAILKDLLDRNRIPNQSFANRSDIRGGSTLGNISNSHVSILSADIGLAQLAMHSIMETAGTKDVGYMIKGIKAFYKAHLHNNGLK